MDFDLFMQAKKIKDSLLEKSCTLALQWCNENKSNLKKIKSSLEFNLRLQEYIELVREKNINQAIVYMRKNMSCFADTHLKEIQQVINCSNRIGT